MSNNFTVGRQKVNNIFKKKKVKVVICPWCEQQLINHKRCVKCNMLLHTEVFKMRNVNWDGESNRCAYCKAIGDNNH